jgi:hypothetical protein
MNEHLSSREIDEWLIGRRTHRMEVHLQACTACADELQLMAGPLKLFGSAVRSYGDEIGPTGRWSPTGKRIVLSGWFAWRWRMALVAAGLLVMIAAPVYHREEVKRQAAVTAAQDEILLRQVESGISRSVPAPMEPLATLISNDVAR